ncbi:tyrosine-type recombinase/integrase [Crateriforma conspicua]|nr:tyrosine-type recombinase/integrase [Crateriforma conspicua]
MSSLVERYIAYRRSLGYRIHSEAYLLRSFGQYADNHAAGRPLTVEVALQWATNCKGKKRIYHAKRLDVVRSLARYLAVFDDRTEIPMRGLLGRSYDRIPPYIFAPAEISLLLGTCLTYAPSFKRDPMTGLRNATVIGLLACTGMRIGEVLALKNEHVDLDEGVLRVCHSKNLPMRLVPVSDSARISLLNYRIARDRQFGNADQADPFIRSPRGGHLPYTTMRCAFDQLLKRANLNPENGRKPRLHDLRHTFACNHLLRAYQEDCNIDDAVHELSVYLGHATLTSTYWYLSSVPILMQQCSKRSESSIKRARLGGES